MALISTIDASILAITGRLDNGEHLQAAVPNAEIINGPLVL